MIELHGTSNKWLRLAMSGGLAYISFSHVTIRLLKKDLTWETSNALLRSI